MYFIILQKLAKVNICVVYQDKKQSFVPKQQFLCIYVPNLFVE